jgi:Pyruvate/2-oxoacid:ferredoxin oxidoreductase delta subunit
MGESSDIWSTLAKRLENAVLLCWLHPRPAQWLLRRHQIAADGLTILNLSNFADADSVVSAIIDMAQDGRQPRPEAGRPAGASEPAPGTIEPLRESTHPRWYPIIDASRCVHCGHCFQFCLFGVYELDGQDIVAVRNPDQCKPGCPACSRICPQSAIMFPLHRNDPAIAGAPGQFVVLDAAARKMFYSRTRQPCPLCGQTAGSRPSAALSAGGLCAECGRPRPLKSPAAGAAPTVVPVPFDDLDDLIDRLDQQTQRRP